MIPCATITPPDFLLFSQQTKPNIWKFLWLLQSFVTWVEGSTARCCCCWCCSKIDSFQLVAWHVKLHHLAAVNYLGRADLWGSGKPESQTRRHWHGLLAEWNNPLLLNLSRQIISTAPTDEETVLLYNMKPWGRTGGVDGCNHLNTGFGLHFCFFYQWPFHSRNCLSLACVGNKWGVSGSETGVRGANTCLD